MPSSISKIYSAYHGSFENQQLSVQKNEFFHFKDFICEFGQIHKF